MDIIYNFMFFLLNLIKGVVGSYGLAIIVLTALIRGVLWPLNTAQTRSMKKMQELQPKIKAIQDRYKGEPQKMQEQLMKFYSENKFNPLAGCLPMLVQLPIFIGLYGMLVSPDFLAAAGTERFFFIDNLSHTLTSHAGEPMDQRFSIESKDQFVTAKHVQVVMDSGTTVDYPVRDVKKVLQVEPQPLVPGDPITISLDPQYLGEQGFSESFVQNIKEASLVVVNESTKELERTTFIPQKTVGATPENPTASSWVLSSKIPTEKGEFGVHWGVLYLILFYALVTVLYQKVMQKGAAAVEGPQAQMMKLMPLMFVGFLIFLPIPAGVILYLVVTMLLMFVQTAWVRWVDEREDGAKTGGKKPPSNQIVDVKPEGQA